MPMNNKHYVLLKKKKKHLLSMTWQLLSDSNLDETSRMEDVRNPERVNSLIYACIMAEHRQIRVHYQRGSK